jgi:hypothetical protein
MSARTGFEITRSFASGAASAAALARSRTIEAFVLNRSVPLVRLLIFPSRFSKHTIASHSRLSRYTSGDEDDLSTGQGFLESGRRWVITSDCALCVDMADISSNTYFRCKKVRWTDVQFIFLERTDLDLLEYHTGRAQ